MKADVKVAPQGLIMTLERKHFKCKCGGLCFHDDDVEPLLIKTLNMMQEELGVQFIINSGFRCPEHNNNVGGTLQSRHLFGLAADVATPKGMTSEEFAMAGEKHQPFANGGIGLYDTFVHFDVRGRRARWDRRTVAE